MINLGLVNLYDYVSIPVKNSIPLGILSLNTVLQNSNDIKSSVIDFHRIYENREMIIKENINDNINDVVKYLLERKLDVIGFSIMYNTFHLSILLANKIKEHNSKIKIVLGGAQVQSLANEIMEEFNCIDGVMIGEGENIISNCVISLFDTKPNLKNGILMRIDGRIIGNTKTDFIENLDELPIIDLNPCGVSNFKQISIDVGRGCPFSCMFCSTRNFWGNKFRIKSAKKIFEELIYYNKKYGITDFSFQHDLFVFNKKIVEEVCDLIIDNSLNITWGCSSRIDTISNSLLEKMAKAGCNSTFFGIETGSNRMQKIVNKNLKIDYQKIDEVLALLNKLKISLTFSFIYAFPKETEDDLRDTLLLFDHIFFKLLDQKNIANSNVQLHKLIYFPGTQLTSENFENLTLRDGGNFDGYFNTDYLEEELSSFIVKKKLFIHFYDDKNEIRVKYPNLDWLMTNFYKLFVQFAPSTFKYLLEHYENDILKLFYELGLFIKRYKSSDIFVYKGENIFDMIMLHFNIIEDFLEISVNKIIINTIFNFEKTLFKVAHIEKEDCELDLCYEYQVLEVKSKINFSHKPKLSEFRIIKKNGNAKVYLQEIKEA